MNPSDFTPESFPATQHTTLNDRQLLALFESICTSCGITQWMAPEDEQHFDATADDIRDELNKLAHLHRPDAIPDAEPKLNLDHALRMIAWKWEYECFTV